MSLMSQYTKHILHFFNLKRCLKQTLKQNAFYLYSKHKHKSSATTKVAKSLFIWEVWFYKHYKVKSQALYTGKSSVDRWHSYSKKIYYKTRVGYKVRLVLALHLQLGSTAAASPALQQISTYYISKADSY